MQITNSFKVRGALNTLLNLSPEAKAKGVITFSSGNFGHSLAYLSNKLGIEATIVMPKDTSENKVVNAKQYSASVILFGDNFIQGFEKVRELVDEKGLTPLHTYDDLNLIIGNASLALEIFEDLPSISEFFCPIGGGGAIAGSSECFKLLNPQINIIGIEPVLANDFYLSLEKGSLVSIEYPQTIADGLKANVVGENCWPLMKKNIDHCLLVEDKSIRKAMRFLYNHMDMRVEPSGAAAISILFSENPPKLSGDSVFLVSGGNIDKTNFDKLIK